MKTIDSLKYPLSNYFLSGYLSKGEDAANFPTDQVPGVFERNERLFESALSVLGITKEDLKRRPEFNLDSGDAKNYESAIATLRVAVALHDLEFRNVELIKPNEGTPSADVTCEKKGQKVCCEIKAITKQSTARPEPFLEDEIYRKILDVIGRARKQLSESAKRLQCTIKIFACVLNWLEHSVVLGPDSYQMIVDKLEKDNEQESLTGVDGVLFVTKMGQKFLFLNENGKRIDS